MKIIDLIAFIREKKYCERWNDGSLVDAINKAIDQNLLMYSTKDGIIDAFVFGYFESPTQVHVCCMHGPGKAKLYIQELLKRHPQITHISRFKHNRNKTITHRIYA